MGPDITKTLHTYKFDLGPWEGVHPLAEHRRRLPLLLFVEPIRLSLAEGVPKLPSSRPGIRKRDLVRIFPLKTLNIVLEGAGEISIAVGEH